MNFMFHIFPYFFCAIFVLMLGVIIGQIVREIGARRKNDRAPRLTVPATVVGKRTDLIRRGGREYPQMRSLYYATFQVESGDRMELQMDGSAYGMLVEGDRGRVTFQGTRYLGFERV